ncbi:hypothetical protein TTHERM_000439149 (macronuclear) [Tetrahymena thermophila SB210]|uniref:Uncharacterized protein n=1 Tax=Tetrahymena thermophila (strain SB210) TaxID=312017 RepID=W7X9C9_TETTS|nr:hypothetical protein TTHERM_000439149 [Tetrahymena thermophila SB210]EWS73962.1 hypothetical protein TTHERM_000439149 [Tetrahymena thermophila SB210]|eukprot:XP_012653503.1 hypothetical protein TTHERM_000439149 [Tetrahymena thermophila SB210]
MFCKIAAKNLQFFLINRTQTYRDMQRKNQLINQCQHRKVSKQSRQLLKQQNYCFQIRQNLLIYLFRFFYKLFMRDQNTIEKLSKNLQKCRRVVFQFVCLLIVSNHFSSKFNEPMKQQRQQLFFIKLTLLFKFSQ